MKTPLLLSALIGLAGVAHAQSFFFTATLSGANENPPNSSPAVGFASVTYNLNVAGNPNDDTLSYSVSYFDFGSPSTAAHIHGPAAFGANAGVIIPLSINAGATSGSFSGSTALTSTQTASLTSALLTQTANGSLAYVNIHSSGLPGGEIRGQLVQLTAVPEVESSVIVGAVLGLGAVVLRRRRA